MDNGGEGSFQAEEGGLSGLVSPENSGKSRLVWAGQRVSSFGGRRKKSSGWTLFSVDKVELDHLGKALFIFFVKLTKVTRCKRWTRFVPRCSRYCWAVLVDSSLLLGVFHPL